jgi:TPR repeat protein
MRKSICWGVLVISTGLAPIPAWADLYSASAATEKKEFAKAFELYRELAEMGQPEAQENLAVMYVNGEGVKRDNVLGYAWAAIALENGDREAAQGIVSQLAPHMTDAALARASELKSKFGQEALAKTLLPVRRVRTETPVPRACNIVAVADPDNYYPREARNRQISGDTMVEFLVYGDGRAHDPRSTYSFPPEVFGVAGRNVSLYNRATPKVENGVAVPCRIRIRVKFSISPAGHKDALEEQIVATRERARRGDPMAQLAYAVVIENRPDLAEKDELPIGWYLKAAQAGIPAAQHVVGANALTGMEVEQDEVKGLLWLNKAAGAGNSEAQLALANYHLQMLPDSAALAAAVDWFDKAVAGGSRDARFYFAALLATGPDAALRNPTRALELIEQAKGDFGLNPIWSEIRAAAYAASGDFEKAKKEQGAAVRMAGRLGWNTAPQEARLADYAVSKPWSGDLFAFY